MKVICVDVLDPAGMVKVSVLFCGTLGLKLVKLQFNCPELKLHPADWLFANKLALNGKPLAVMVAEFTMPPLVEVLVTDKDNIVLPP